MSDQPKPLTTLDFVAMKRAGRKIVSLTAYDALMARMLDASGVDLILVGDSVNQVVAGRQLDAERHARPDDLPRPGGAGRRPPGPGGGGPAVPQLPGDAGGRHPERRPRAAGDRCRGREARGRRDDGADHPGAGGAGDPGDGPPRAHAAVGARPRRLPGAGQGGGGRGAPAGRRARGRGGRARSAWCSNSSRPRSPTRDHEGARDSRPSASAPAPAATGRCWCCPTCSA